MIIIFWAFLPDDDRAYAVDPMQKLCHNFQGVSKIRSIGILDHLDGFRIKGISISSIVTAMCTHTLMGNNSMSRCSDWLSNSYVCK